MNCSRRFGYFCKSEQIAWMTETQIKIRKERRQPTARPSILLILTSRTLVTQTSAFTMEVKSGRIKLRGSCCILSINKTVHRSLSMSKAQDAVGMHNDRAS